MGKTTSIKENNPHFDHSRNEQSSRSCEDYGETHPAPVSGIFSLSISCQVFLYIHLLGMRIPLNVLTCLHTRVVVSVMSLCVEAHWLMFLTLVDVLSVGGGRNNPVQTDGEGLVCLDASNDPLLLVLVV